MSSPIDWTALEDAIHDWTAEALGLSGDRVGFVEPELAGAILPPPQSAQIFPVAGPRALFKPKTIKVPGITRYRVRILADGPGDAGVRFYAGDSLTPLDIPLAAGPGDAPEVTAAALALAVDAATPAGYSAVVDPLELADVVVEGSEADPLFALASVDQVFASTTLERARFTEVDFAWSRVSWRVELRSLTARGFGSAPDLLGRLSSSIVRLLAPRLHRVGWLYKGILASVPTLPPVRVEFRSALDFAVEGYASTHYQITPARQIAIQVA